MLHGAPLSTTFNLPNHISKNLQASVQDFIVSGSWSVPLIVQNRFPGINLLVQQVTLPVNNIEDKMVWNNTTHGVLTLKEAYMFKTPGGQNVHWSKLVWNQDIPPTKSLLTWRLMHQRLSTDDNLMLRGCSLASIYS